MRSKDVSGSPELLALAEEVARTEEPCVLRRNGKDVAMVVPVATGEGRRPRRGSKDWRPSEEELAKARSAYGAWKDVDTDKLLEDIYATRDLPGRPPVKL
jgi:hypothetical protein